jgi:hypothetical protein
MSRLGTRVARLEAGRPRPSPFDAIDPILAALSMPEIVALVRHGTNLERGIRPTPEQEAVYGVVRDRLAFVGTMLP